jgi:hypothetical protein
MTEIVEIPYDQLMSRPAVYPPASLGALYDEVGQRNRHIRCAYDPAFDGRRVRVCADRSELAGWLYFGSWSNGSAFALEEGGQWLAFIQQGECTDEWLVVKAVPTTFKGRPAWMFADFESISCHRIVTRRPEKFGELLDDLFAATLDECRSLEYTGAAQRRRDPWTPVYDAWRHGGWYVRDVRYPSGACGCVSRNYSDGKWRIVCQNTGPGSDGDVTYPSRDAAARAERDLAEAMCAAERGGLRDA